MANKNLIKEDIEDTDASWFERVGGKSKGKVTPPKTPKKISTEEVLDYDEELISFFNQSDYHDKNGAIKAIKEFAAKRNWDISKVDLDEVISQLFNLEEAESTTADIAPYAQNLGVVKRKKTDIKCKCTKEEYEPIEYINNIPVFEVSIQELIYCSKVRKAGRNRYYLKTESIMKFLKDSDYRKPVMIKSGCQYLRLK